MGRVWGWTPALERADRKLHQAEMVKEGDPERLVDQTLVHEFIGEDGKLHAVPRTRKKVETGSGAYIDDDTVTFHGDPIKTVHEEVDRDRGTVTRMVERIDPTTGKSIGTYEMTWERTGDGQMTHSRNRRIFT